MSEGVLKRLSYAFIPKRCPLCGSVVAFDEILCEDCQALERLEGERCKKCGAEKEHCSCISSTPKPAYEGIASPFYFQGNIIHAIHNFKLNGYKELSSELSNEMLLSIRDCYKEVQLDAVTYVPMHKFREKMRGYNQSQLLADDVANGLGIEPSNLLKKLFWTKQQRGSSARKRRNNLYGSIDINVPFDEIEGKTILLIDDVKTTGATLNECASVLKGYGARAVYCATIAVTKKEEQND